MKHALGGFHFRRIDQLAPLIAAACFFATLNGCKKSEPPWKNHNFNEVEASREEVQAQLPRSLWNKIIQTLPASGPVASAEPEAKNEHENKDPGGGHEAKGEHGSEPAVKSDGPLPSVFAPVRVHLIEKNPGILTRGHTTIEFAAGGGTLDLSEYVSAKNGSFFLVFEFVPDLDEVKRHVFFLSGAIKRKLNGDVVGAGCNTYFDISEAAEKAAGKEGFLVNTTGGRHASALAGTYFFSAAHAGKLYLAALSITDSTRKPLLCEH